MNPNLRTRGYTITDIPNPDESQLDGLIALYLQATDGLRTITVRIQLI